MLGILQGHQRFAPSITEQSWGGILGGFSGFMKQNTKWWLLPLIIVSLLFGLLIFLSGTGLTPFIDTLS